MANNDRQFIDIAGALTDLRDRKYTDVVDMYFKENQYNWRWYYDEVFKAINGSQVIPQSTKDSALRYCESRKNILAEAEQKNNEASSKDEKLWAMTVHNLELQNQLTPLLIEESRKKDQTIEQQRKDLIAATDKTTRSTLRGAIWGAAITIIPTIWLAYMKPDTVVLPPIQLAHDTIQQTVHDTVYLTDSLKKP
jgi:hypothetical protein